MRAAESRSRSTAKVTMASSTATAKKSSAKPSQGSRPIHHTAKSRSNSAPHASRIVNNRNTNPQNVKKCAMPGIDHFSNLR